MVTTTVPVVEAVKAPAGTAAVFPALIVEVVDPVAAAAVDITVIPGRETVTGEPAVGKAAKRTVSVTALARALAATA